jgi:hypothetical protein
VASPLVMAKRGTGATRADAPWALRVCSCLKPLPPASQGGSATRNDHRPRRPTLRLRCAPPSAKSRAAHAKASKSGHPASFAPERASCEAGCERSNTSAERSEAREDDVSRPVTCRVASPLVMATRGRRAKRADAPWALRVCPCLKPLPPASQGGSATRNDHRPRRPTLRLRCAPPSSASRAVHARASESGGREPTVRPAASCERSNTSA